MAALVGESDTASEKRLIVVVELKAKGQLSAGNNQRKRGGARTRTVEAQQEQRRMQSGGERCERGHAVQVELAGAEQGQKKRGTILRKGAERGGRGTGREGWA